MIKNSNHLGTITVSKRYLVKLVTSLAQGCFGIADLSGVEITQTDNAVDIRLNVTAAGDVNLPAVAAAVSHKVSYVLTNQTGVTVRSVEIFTDDVI